MIKSAETSIASEYNTFNKRDEFMMVTMVLIMKWICDKEPKDEFEQRLFEQFSGICNEQVSQN